MKRTHEPRLGGIIVALALALTLAGCSAVKLGYDSLQQLAYWWLDGYVDLSGEQQPVVRAELARLHAWHRQKELPRWADLLARAEQLAPGDIRPSQACAIVAEARVRLEAVADAAEPAATAFARTLAGRQLRFLERKFAERDARFRQEFVEPPAAQRLDKRYAQWLERLESVYGRLDDAQRALLRQGLARSEGDPQRVLAERQRRQQDLLQTLRRLPHVPAEQARGQLSAWLERALYPPDPAYRAWQEGRLEADCRLFAAVHASTTPAQREEAVRQLRGYQRALRELAASPPL
jgi:hypothetical protein